MKRKLPEKFFEQNQKAKTRRWKFFNLNQALWGAGNREFRILGNPRILFALRALLVPHNRARSPFCLMICRWKWHFRMLRWERVLLTLVEKEEPLCDFLSKRCSALL